MGGDDLGSEDEFLAAPLKAEDASSEDSVQEEDAFVDQRILNEESTEAQPPAKKRRKEGDSLRRLGPDLRNQSLENQAKLLSQFTGTTFRQHQMAKAQESPSLAKRIQGIISKKKLKKWKGDSPCVLIVCLSARRAVQVLKELSPFNVRAAKLFAKHMTIDDQKDTLASGTFGLAVGTPHRILMLAQLGALSLKETQLVVLDTFLNAKNFSVYTMPDTVPHTVELLKEQIEPQCNKRKDLRVAFL